MDFKDSFLSNIDNFIVDSHKTDSPIKCWNNNPVTFEISNAKGNLLLLKEWLPKRHFDTTKVKNVEFLPKEGKPKVVKMYFTDGVVTTSVPQEGDEFNAETGMIMCILKYIWNGSGYNTFFRKWIKKDEKRRAKIEEEKVKAAEEVERKKAKKEKNEARRAVKEEKDKKEFIDILAQAIKLAAAPDKDAE